VATNYKTLKEIMLAERVRLLLTEFDRLDDSLELNTAEVAVVVNRSVSTLKLWARSPNHAIKWRRRGKQKATTVACVRKFLQAEPPRETRGRPRKQPPLVNEVTNIT
jgi:hypothetical protein